MDNLTLRGYSATRPWMKSDRPSTGIESTKPLSKLDSARLKLSKFQLKYGKQERQGEVDSELSLSSEDSSTKTSLHSAKLKVDDNVPHLKKSSSNDSNDRSQNTTNHSLEIVSKNEDLLGVRLPPETILSQLSLQHVESPQDSSLSEISENVHSFSSLLKSTNSFHALEKNESLVSGVEMVSVQHRQETQTSDSSIIDTVSSELKEQVVQLTSLLASPLVVSEIPKLQDTQSSVHSIQVVKTQSNETSVSSKLDNSKRSSSTTSFVKYSPAKSSYNISSPTSGSGKKEPIKRRNAKVQTDTKRSRRVQVDLSWTESMYEIRSCPILRASSLPPGLRIRDDSLNECLDIIGLGDAVQVLLKSQLRLTLGFLQREQALYLNSCMAAARLEKGYRQHTLSDTRKFIYCEKRLRGELRKDAKLEKRRHGLVKETMTTTKKMSRV